MKLCFPSHFWLATLWVLAFYASQGIRAYRKGGRASHVMRGFDVIPSDIQLYQPCRSSFDCLIYIPHSHCDWDKRVCTCQPHHVAYNNSMCLPASLLGFGCVLDTQCQLKVPHSVCVNGLCECEPVYLPLRRDKCLPPAKVDDFCLSDRQCHMVSSYSYCKYIIPHVYGMCKCPLGYLKTAGGKCLPHLGSICDRHEDCQLVTANSICQKTGRTAICACREGYEVSPNGIECYPTNVFATSSKLIHPASLGQVCQSSEECQARDPNSICKNGICNCAAPNDACNVANRGCHNDTFQCRNGYCISWYFVCDKQMNCPDNSDEAECVPFNCPKEAFQCDDGTCLSRGQVCNGRWECPDGSDEARCYTGIPCDRKAFRCRNGQCVPQYAFCNAVQDCLDGSDEYEEICDRGETCPVKSFQCENGRCRSTAILCSGLDGCGDDSDETSCEVCYCKEP